MSGIVSVMAESAAVSAGAHILGGDEFPVRFDLRDYGVVTPVKYQGPWSTCWSFGGIAAADFSRDEIVTGLEDAMKKLDMEIPEYLRID